MNPDLIGAAKIPRSSWSANNTKLALRADIFEASHTYCLKGLGKYLTIVEAQGVATA